MRNSSPSKPSLTSRYGPSYCVLYKLGPDITMVANEYLAWVANARILSRCPVTIFTVITLKVKI